MQTLKIIYNNSAAIFLNTSNLQQATLFVGRLNFPLSTKIQLPSILFYTKR